MYIDRPQQMDHGHLERLFDRSDLTGGSICPLHSRWGPGSERGDEVRGQRWSGFE
jgi:hypothetical protein